MITKTKLIVALIALQGFTHAFYFFQVHGALESEATCQLSKITQTTALINIINDLNAEFDHLQRSKEKTTYHPKIMVNK